MTSFFLMEAAHPPVNPQFYFRYCEFLIVGTKAHKKHTYKHVILCCQILQYFVGGG